MWRMRKNQTWSEIHKPRGRPLIDREPSLHDILLQKAEQDRVKKYENMPVGDLVMCGVSMNVDLNANHPCWKNEIFKHYGRYDLIDPNQNAPPDFHPSYHFYQSPSVEINLKDLSGYPPIETPKTSPVPSVSVVLAAPLEVIYVPSNNVDESESEPKPDSEPLSLYPSQIELKAHPVQSRVDLMDPKNLKMDVKQLEKALKVFNK